MTDAQMMATTAQRVVPQGVPVHAAARGDAPPAWRHREWTHQCEVGRPDVAGGEDASWPEREDLARGGRGEALRRSSRGGSSRGSMRAPRGGARKTLRAPDPTVCLWGEEGAVGRAIPPVV